LGDSTVPTPRSTLIVSWVSTFVVGILSGFLGPLLPVLSGRVAVSVETLGSLFTALFLGALATQFSGGWLNERVGLRNMVLAGTAFLTIGVVGITFSPNMPLILVCACLAGAGQGALDISTNVLVAAVFDERKVVTAVNVLHFAFGAGAVLSPVGAALAVRQWGTPMPVLWIAAVIGVVNLVVATRMVMNPVVARAGGARVGNGIYGRPELWLLAALMFLYVGVEMGVGGWTTVYMGRTTALPASSIAWVVSGYWLALTGGRLVGAALGTRIGSRALTALSLIGCCLGALVLLVSGGNVALTVAGTLLCGVSFGPVFPTVVVIATEIFRASPSRAVSVVISVSSLGGMLLPPLQGVLLARVSPLASIAQLTLSAFAMLGLLLVVQRYANAERRCQRSAA
jgi:MFS transporter, FHS family, glucose/mannose:H+ symporter